MKTFLLISLTSLALAAFPAAWGDDDVPGRILRAALEDGDAYEKLCFLCDRIGCRLSGSEALGRAVEWARSTMAADGLSNVRLLPAKVPVWVRGEESAALLEPARHPLVILGLGGSVGTPPEGITAEVAVLGSFDQLSDAVKGKIVLFNVPFTTYGETVAYRVRGAIEAAKHGALAVLVRSVTPYGLRTPHTGMMRYEEGGPRIPAAAVTIEDAELMQRLTDRGQMLRAVLRMGAHEEPDADSADVIGEVPGETDEVVLIGAHLDSWDVGSGAHDDGGGVVSVMSAARLLVKLGLKPRRTIRVVLFVNEENGLRGAQAYFEAHKDVVGKHIAAIETDSGIDDPVGFGLSVKGGGPREEAGLTAMREIAKPLAAMGAARIQSGGGGADIGPLGEAGVPTLGLDTDMATYWHYHHTPADTVDKVDPGKLKKHVAVLAVMAWGIANLPGPLVPPAPAESGGVADLVHDLASPRWGVARASAQALESRGAEAIEALVALLDRDECVPLQDTADLIYPGAKTFYGHGYLIDYDLDRLPVRAGWVLEAITFRDFGFRDGALEEDELLRAAAAGARDVPLDQVVALKQDPEARRRQRAVAVARAKKGWAGADRAAWTRLGDLVEALGSGSPARQVAALGWLRYGETACPGLDRKSYDERVLPAVRPLADSPDRGVRDQTKLLLEDREGYGLSLKGKK